MRNDGRFHRLAGGDVQHGGFEDAVTDAGELGQSLLPRFAGAEEGRVHRYPRSIRRRLDDDIQVCHLVLRRPKEL